MMELWNGGAEQPKTGRVVIPHDVALKAIIPLLHYSIIPEEPFTAKPFVSDLARRIRFSSMQ
ncbi:MAG: hypothetical protein CVU57_07355 [Deltaproteobacteria bacterium HGW-Deltaproteobacteria-15]|jgi:hypothetical protein|nr:MAG: hypothetical protein CVU57_07355 [Deltaproteobacteria bacterium HGW-Deltaproteobacteria-15]